MQSKVSHVKTDQTENDARPGQQASRSHSLRTAQGSLGCVRECGRLGVLASAVQEELELELPLQGTTGNLTKAHTYSGTDSADNAALKKAHEAKNTYNS